MNDSNCAPQKPMPPQDPVAPRPTIAKGEPKPVHPNWEYITKPLAHPDNTNAAALSQELKTAVRRTQAMHCTRTPPMEQELIEGMLAELSVLAVNGSQIMQVWNNIQRLAIEGEKYIREQYLNDDFTK